MDAVRARAARRPARFRLPPLAALLVVAAACGDGSVGTRGAITTTQIAAGGFVFDARVAGPEAGEAVLLLHGFPQSSLEWEAQLGTLGRAGYHVVAPDLRGYSPGARPEGPAAYTQDLLAADVIAIADEIGASTFDLVGHDWGAAIAWQVAMLRPERLRSLTAVSVPHPRAYAEALANDPEQQQQATYIDFFQQAGVAEQVLLADDAAVLRGIHGSGPAAAHADAYVALLTEAGALTAALDYYRALGLGGVRLDDVQVPTLYVWSTADTALARYGAERTGLYVDGPYRFEVLEGVSHWVPEEAADDLDALLLEHLAATP